MAFNAMNKQLPTGTEILFGLTYTCVSYTVLFGILACSLVYRAVRRVAVRRRAGAQHRDEVSVSTACESAVCLSSAAEPSAARGECCAPSWAPQTVGDIVTHWMCSSWANTIILGQPIIRVLIGEAEAERLPFFHYFISLVTNFPLFVILLETHTARDSAAAAAEEEEEAPRAAPMCVRVLLRVVLHPILIAMVLGVLWSLTGLALPEMVTRPLTWISNSVTAVGLFIVGLFASLHRREIEFAFPALYVALRMFVSPLLMALFCVAFDLPPLEARVSVTLAATPLAVSCFSMLTEYGVNPQRAPPSIFFGVVLLLPQQILLQWLLDALPRFAYHTPDA